MKQTLLIIAGSALATAAVMLGSPAHAAPAASQAVRIVSTAGLDLASEPGCAALDHRLVIAARDVCGAASDTDLAGKNDVRECRKSVLAEARRQSKQLAENKGVILLAANR